MAHAVPCFIALLMLLSVGCFGHFLPDEGRGLKQVFGFHVWTVGSTVRRGNSGSQCS